MKKILFSIVLGSMAIIVIAQDTTSTDGPWKFKGMTSINFSQLALTNWAQGGDNAVALNTLASMNLDYTQGNKSWVNVIDVGYGIQKVGERETGKTDDHLDILSKYGQKASGYWYFSGLMNLKTQFAEGYKVSDTGKELISDFLSPGYLTVSIGMEYKPNDNFFASISPLSGKITMVLNDSLSLAGRFGVEPGESVRAEFGGSARIGLNREIMKNVTLTTTFDLFTNYLKNPQNIDVSWKALINMKINEFLSANLSTHLLYDDDIDFVNAEGVSGGPRVQFKELFGVGFSVKF